MSDLTDELHVHDLSVAVACQIECDLGQDITLILAQSLS